MIVEITPDGILVREARSVELIAAELFETANPRWLHFWDVSESPVGVTGWFSVQASNGAWTYRLTRRVPSINGVFEAELVEGEPVLPCV